MNDERPETVPQRAVHLALRIFGENLRLAFVGGSHARGTAGATSDVDVFVVLLRPDRDAERAFAEVLRDLHEAEGLTFDHCGEVMDATTLDELLTFTSALLNELPGVLRMACYQADCLLSVFRKGDVIYKFLDDDKIQTTGDLVYLAGLETRALEYFELHPMPRVQELKGGLSLPAGSVQARSMSAYEARLEGSTWPDTPVGIGLERWFGGHRPPTPSPASAGRRSNGPPTGRCPLTESRPPGDGPSVAASAVLLRSQCLAFTHRPVRAQHGGHIP